MLCAGRRLEWLTPRFLCFEGGSQFLLRSKIGTVGRLSHSHQSRSRARVAVRPSEYRRWKRITVRYFRDCGVVGHLDRLALTPRENYWRERSSYSFRFKGNALVESV